jgi:hypothetical protein
MRGPVIAVLSAAAVLVGACSQTTYPNVSPTTTHTTGPVTKIRKFASAFETLRDFAGMYVTPQTASTRQQLVSSPRHRGALALCGSLTGPGTAADTDGPNHRAYPTVQLWRLPTGGFATPAVVDLWVWADVVLQRGQWVSFATLSADASDRWSRVVTVNLDPGDWIDVFHVPDQGQHRPLLETHRPFPQRTWVHLSIRIDFDQKHGSIAVRQDGVLVARANVRGGHGVLEQAHFGMYAIPTLTTGKVCNDDLTITSTPGA